MSKLTPAANSARSEDINDYLMVRENPISRVGVFPYYGKDIPGAEEPNKVYYVYRPADELADQDAIDSFKNIPIIDDHDMLGDEAKGLLAPERKGIHGTVTGDVAYRDGTLLGDLKIFSQSLKNMIKMGKDNLSLGYRCIYEKASGVFEGRPYEYIQRSLRGNHLALVDEARSNVAVLDHALAFDSFNIKIHGGEPAMAEEDKTTKDEKEMTMAEVSALFASVVPQIAEMQKALAGLQKPEDNDSSALVIDEDDKDKKSDVEDEDDDKDKKAKAEDMDEGAGDKNKDELAVIQKGAAMDAKLKALTKEVYELKKSGTKALLAEISERDRLAGELSAHVGVFDHASKTLGEVAKYGVEKLGLKCPEGHEATVLSGFLAGSKQPGRNTAISMDSANSNQPNSITRYINGQK